MADALNCQRCGAVLGLDAAQGLCPACLLEQGLRDSQAPLMPGGAAPNVPADLAELAPLFPHLDLLELVGRGGMGVVYKARHRGLDRFVALKILPPGVDHDPGFQERFVREARALARLNHPNIVAVYDFGQIDGRYYFLMEFIDGANLRQMLQAGHLLPQQAMAIVPQLCDALQFAHEEGIVHRDIKPENILVDRKGRVKIADFGLAKLLNGLLPQDPYTLTAPRQVLGTPHYMAPEQFERPGTVDHRADIYSMGVVFYEMLTGELPLGRFPPPSRKVQVDVRLDEVVLRTLEKEPEQRYQRAGQVKTELASLATLPPGGGPPTWSTGGPGRIPGAATDGAPSKLSPYAIAGFLAALPFLLGLLACMVVFGLGGGVEPEFAVMVGVANIIAAIVCAVSSCALGLAALRQIRNSHRRYFGLKLALFDTLLYPLLLLDLLIFIATIVILESAGLGQEGLVILVSLVAAFTADVYIVRRAWRWVARANGIGVSPPALRPAQPAHPLGAAPERQLGCFGMIAAAMLILLLIGLIALVPYIMAYRRADSATATPDARVASVGADVNSDATSTGEAHTYRFEVHAPIDTKTTLWAEVWKNGTLQNNPGFEATQWIIPAPGQPFQGLVTFKLTPAEDRKVKAGWQISGNAGSVLSERSIPDPLADMPLRDSTWGRWTGSWSISHGKSLPILVLRGAMERIVGSADDPNLVGHAQGEIRLFARFDPLTPAEKQSRPMIGSSPNPPARNLPASQPATRPIEPAKAALMGQPPITESEAPGINTHAR